MAVKSWVGSANEADTDFPIQNLPYGVFRRDQQTRIGVAIGDQILDLRACSEEGLFRGLSKEITDACREDSLNSLMSLGPASWSSLRRCVTALLDAEQAGGETRAQVEAVLAPMAEAVMQLPARIGDYTDFYASIHHATRVGKLFRPENPLLPNYKYIPIGYHGRASSIVVSGQEVRRPCGQSKPSGTEPVFGPSRSLDYELEIGAFVGPGSSLGQSIPIAEAKHHIFGLCLLNDWSARDIQSWEYQPLGPFLAKNFATTISPWVVTMEALAPYGIAPPSRSEGDPAPLEYLREAAGTKGAIDVRLEVYVQSQRMREESAPPVLLSTSNLRDLYWTIPQLLTHHASNGCNLRPGDLIATGTISGPDEGSEGCLLEMKHRATPIRLPNGEERSFLADGDRVVFLAYCERPGLPRIGFGECAGTIIAAQQDW
jgi:fumarylacetoacetase